MSNSEYADYLGSVQGKLVHPERVFARTLDALAVILGAFIFHLAWGISLYLGPAVAEGSLGLVYQSLSSFFPILVIFVCCRGLYLANQLQEKNLLIGQVGAPLLFFFLWPSFNMFLFRSSSNVFSGTKAGLGVFLLVSCIGLLSLWKVMKAMLSYEIVLFQKVQHTVLRDLWVLTKPRLTALVATTAFLGMLITPKLISVNLMMASLLFTTLLIMGSCMLNCYLEIDVDRKMERTRDRCLPSGRMQPKVALITGSLLVCIGALGLLIEVNTMTALLGVLASILYLYAYTPLKQKGLVALYVGAVSGALPPLMGRTTVTGKIDFLGLCLFGILFFWQLPHFLAISVFHSQDYKRADIVIFPNVFGAVATKWWIFVFTIVQVIMTLVAATAPELGAAYYPTAWVLGILTLMLSIYGLIHLRKGVEWDKLWAKKFFWSTLIYLPVLFASMLFFK